MRSKGHIMSHIYVTKEAHICDKIAHICGITTQMYLYWGYICCQHMLFSAHICLNRVDISLDCVDIFLDCVDICWSGWQHVLLSAHICLNPVDICCILCWYMLHYVDICLVRRTYMRINVAYMRGKMSIYTSNIDTYLQAYMSRIAHICGSNPTYMWDFLLNALADGPCIKFLQSYEPIVTVRISS